MALLAYLTPFTAIAFGLLGVAIWLGSIVERRRRAKAAACLAARRSGESICTFARGFDYRRTDTRVLRAVYEELQPSTDIPLRADDLLEMDLHFDDEDLDWDIAPIIAHRTGRPLQDTKRNPYYGRVRTVADLVAFFCAQPLGSSFKA